MSRENKGHTEVRIIGELREAQSKPAGSYYTGLATRVREGRERRERIVTRTSSVIQN